MKFPGVRALGRLCFQSVTWLLLLLSFRLPSLLSFFALHIFLSVVYAGIDTIFALIGPGVPLDLPLPACNSPAKSCHIDLKPPRRPPCFLLTNGVLLMTRNMKAQFRRPAHTLSSRPHKCSSCTRSHLPCLTLPIRSPSRLPRTTIHSSQNQVNTTPPRSRRSCLLSQILRSIPTHTHTAPDTGITAFLRLHCL